MGQLAPLRAIAITQLEAGVRQRIIHAPNADRVPELLELVANLGRDRVKGGPVDSTRSNMVCNAISLGLAAGDPLPVAAALLTLSMFVGAVIAGHGETHCLQPHPAATHGAAQFIQHFGDGRCTHRGQTYAQGVRLCA